MLWHADMDVTKAKAAIKRKIRILFAFHQCSLGIIGGFKYFFSDQAAPFLPYIKGIPYNSFHQIAESRQEDKNRRVHKAVSSVGIILESFF